jgi:sirohydrochlorin cobaltochelatase
VLSVRRFCLMAGKHESALLIIGHGSTVNPDSSAPTLAHAAEIRRQKHFRDVRCAFWKEEPSLRDALFLFDPEQIRHVYVVPNFISEGYFTQTVIPRELELSGRTTKRLNGQAWHYCPPVGNNPTVTELLCRRAKEVAPDVDPAQSSLLIVAHGTGLNENSAVAAKREAEKIRARGEYALVLNVYMEEAPLVSEWKELTNTMNVVVVPFFVADGLHSHEDIPELLGIASASTSCAHPEGRGSGVEASDESSFAESSRCPIPQHGRDDAASSETFHPRNPYHIDGRFLFYSGAIGTDPRFAEIIVEQAINFDRANQLQTVS